MLNTISHNHAKQKQNHNPFKPNNKSKSLTSVRHLLTQLDVASKKRHHSHRKKQVCLDREEIRKQMKQKWRDPGFCNVQFSNFKALKGRFLNDWELSRIFLANRSYQIPKDFKGMKQCYESRQFPKVAKQMHSQKFQSYLSTIEQKKQRTNNNGNKLNTEISRKMYTESAISQNRDLHKFSRQKKTFQGFTGQSKMFGMGTVIWKSGQNRKFKTLQS